ncbi:hypothetical protein HON52_02470 [Candidatus Uhrbacteria bacterium]|nr:hypothetical protein [Candidatus Uhrbacteria bacterium]
MSAAAVSCPATDGGAGDDDATADGTITISSSTSWNTTGYAALGDYWDCTGVDILVTSTSTLTFDGDQVNGWYPYLKTDNLQIDSGSSISGDGQGCTSTNNNTGYGPSGSNVCTLATAGAGIGASTSTTGAGGSGHGGNGGAGTTKAAGSHYDTVTGPLLFGTSGGSGNAGVGGAGGGVVRIDVTTTLTNNGIIESDGAVGGTNSTNRAGGGGSGGSIFISTGTLAGSTGTFSAIGGAGGDNSSADGGGGGGGIISLLYTTDSFNGGGGMAANDFLVSGGSGPGSAADGTDGSAYTLGSATSDVVYYYQLYVDATNVTSSGGLRFDTSVIACESGTADVTLTATDEFYFGGTLTCTDASLTDVVFTGGNDFDIASGSTINVNNTGVDIDFTVPAGVTTTWDDVTITGGVRGTFVIDDAATIDLTGTTSIRSNVSWTNLVALSVGSSTSINADEYGCTENFPGSAVDGKGPDGSNACTRSETGAGGGNSNAGGGGHGGAGGTGNGGSGGAGGGTYGSNTAPVLYGSTGGHTNESNSVAGPGGGIIRLDVSGTLTHAGTISANGGDPTNALTNRSPGGGSGGSIYITSGPYAGSSGTLTTTGGDANGGDTQDSGGGGGGRVSITYSSTSGDTLTTFISDGNTVLAAAGSGSGTGQNGTAGTLYTSASATPPDLTSSVTKDDDGNGQIDQIIATFDLDLNASTVAGSDFTVAGFTVSSASETSAGIVTIILTESGSGDTDALPLVSVVGSVETTLGGELTSDSVTATDEAAPAATFGAYKDTNSDGTIDRIDITFSENIGLDECEAGDYTAGGADAGSIAVASCVASGDDLRLTISNAPSNDTNLTLTVAYTAANGTASSLDDSAGNAVADISATALADGAAPVSIGTQSYLDTDLDGQVDRVDITFSENIAVDECEGGDFTIGGADAGSISVASCATSSADLQLTLSSAPANDTLLTFTVAYTEANGTAGSLDDSAANAVADISALTLADAAAPVLASLAIDDTGGNGLIDQIVMTWSEDVDTNDSAAPVLADFGTILLPDGQTVSSATISDPAGSSAVVTLSSVVGQVAINTGAGSAAVSGITSEWTDGTNATSNPDGSVSIVDNANPFLRTDGSNDIQYEDNNTDGTVDRVRLKFSEAVTIAYTDGDWTATANDLTSFDVSAISSGNGTATIYLTATAQSNTTGVAGGTEPTLAFTASGGSITDANSNTDAAFSAETVDDAAAPALRTDGSNKMAYLDDNEDGTIDRVRLTFTEAATLTYSDGDWSATANDLTGFDTGAYLSGNGTTQILLTASANASLTGVSGGTEPTLAFTPSSGSIVDGGGASLSGISATTLVDEAIPVDMTRSYKDASANGTIDRLDVVFSETITVNECETADFTLAGADIGSVAISACAVSGTDLRLTLTGAPSNDTNLALTFAYDASNGTANSLDDAAGNDATDITTVALTDGAIPVLMSFTYQDDDGDGTIDQVTAVFTEDVTIVYADGDWAVTANDLSGFDVSAYDSGNGSASIILTATADVGVTGVAGGTEPTIEFTATTGSISDGTTTVPSLPESGVADGAAMAILAIGYKDINSDGTIDRLDVTFSEMPTLDECEFGDYTFGGDDSGTIAVSACATSGSDLRLTLSNTPSSDTNIDIEWNYTASSGTSGSLQDGGSEDAASFSDKAVTDQAAPIKVSQAYKDVNADGQVDRFDIVFTENIAYDECEAGDYTVGGADAGSISIASCATSTTSLQLTVSSAPSNDTALTLTLAYTAANGTSNSLDDTAGNAVADLTAAALTDLAAPVSTGQTYLDNDTDGKVDRVTVSFSESITLDECETEDFVFAGTDAGTIAVVDSSGCSVGGSTITFTVANAPSNDTSLSFTWSYANNETAGSLLDAASSAVTSVPAVTLTDLALPQLVSQTYVDANGDGTVDRADLTFTEVITVATCEVGDYAIAGADAGSMAVSACVVSGTDVRYTLTTAPSLDTLLTLTFAYDASNDTANSLVDANSNVLASLSAASLTDGAAAVMRTDGANAPAYGDANADGTIDQVTLTFTEPVTVTYSDGDWTAVANTLTSFDVSGYSSGNGSTAIVLTGSAAANLTGVSGGTEPTLAFTASTGSILDGTSNAISSIGATSLSDEASPVNVSQSYKDLDTDGDIDRLDIVFSETIEVGECEAGDYTIGGADAGSIAVSACVASTTDLRLTLTNTVANTTGPTLTFAYTAANGTADSLDDTDANAVVDISAVAIADAAGAVIVSITPADGATDVSRSADVVVVFSEAINTGSTAYSFDDSPSGLSNAWSVSDTTLTISHSGQFSGSSDITFTTTTANDTTGNALIGPAAGVTHPATFTTASASSSSTVYDSVDPSVGSLRVYQPVDSSKTVTSLSIDEKIKLTWTTLGPENLVDLSYSLNSGSTYTVIEQYMFNNSTYNWTPEGVEEGDEIIFKVELNDIANILSTASSAEYLFGEEEEVVEEEEAENAKSGVYCTDRFVKYHEFSTVYCVTNIGTRRPFVNSLAYFTWADSFDEIEEIEYEEMVSMSVDGLMLPKPGSVLVKIQSIPYVYMLTEQEGEVLRPQLRWITDEEVAIDLFGADWADYVVDMNPAFFSHFDVGDAVDDATLMDVDLSKLIKRVDLSLKSK